MPLHIDIEQKPQSCNGGSDEQHGAQTENDHFSSLCDCIVNIARSDGTPGLRKAGAAGIRQAREENLMNS